ncbi:MAG: ABC-F family ATP-binding cassette domain-containing protein [Planctomycetota bacterium]|nr:ABC-F family ATP-binding cassette domain-containing protein [Planctomycetota bacterium]
MINITGLDYRYGSQIIFDEASVKVETGWTVGLIGPNGCGKTTLFRLITGEEQHEVGEIALPTGSRLGYFDQNVGEMSGCDVVEQAVRSAGRVADLRGELSTLEDALADPEKADDLDRIMSKYSALQAEFQVLGGYDVEPRAREILGGLGFTTERMEADVGILSGGWKMRVALAGVLLQQPDILLLDEPTNHLDLESILWLESFIRDFRGTVVMTCHDHEFLNGVADRILEVDEGKLRLFPGNYDYYLAQRALETDQRQAAFERQQGHINREMRWINSFRAKARSASQAQSRLRALDKLEKLEAPRGRRKKVVFRIPPTKRSGNDIFVAEELTKSFGDLDVFLGLDLHIRRQERWAFLGVNGAGKTTLLKMIHGDVDPDGGKWKSGASLEMGYFAQHSTELLHPQKTVLDSMHGEFPGESIGALRKCLAGFGFDEGDMDKVTSWLSGGEKARLVLALMLFHPPNFLILDEPTNHLDVDSKQTLLEALERYDGTILFVSHDRHFLEAVATHILEIEDGVAMSYSGGYKEYVALTGHAAPGAG